MARINFFQMMIDKILVAVYEKNVRAEMREQERRLASISNNAPGMLYQFKMAADGKFTFPFFSRRSFEYLGVTAEEIIKDASAIINLIHPDDVSSFQESLEITIKNLTPWRWEGRFCAGNGFKWFQGGSTPLKENDGSILWDGILFEITSQKEAEERLRFQEAQLASASKLVALGEMAGGVAHEINTPLNAILFCADQILNSLGEDSFEKDEIIEMSTLISETSQRIAKIVRGLKAFARDVSHEPMETVDLEGVIEESLDLCRQRLNQNGIDIKIVRPREPVLVHCRSVQLGQVLLNLINNSFDAVISTAEAWVIIEVKVEGSTVKIEVSDSGKGLSPSVVKKLFQPFFTTKGPGKGTGIGLSISKGIVESHEGSLYFDHASENTKFVIELPLRSAMSGAA